MPHPSETNGFTHALGIRHLVCGSCNGCEHEMNALTSPQYDITRDGWDIVASPRHADVITVTGPMTQAMRGAARATRDAAAQPCIIVAIGDCAIGEGPWAGAPDAGDGAGIELDAPIGIPGCPPDPAAIRAALAEAARLLPHAGHQPEADARGVRGVAGEPNAQKVLFDQYARDEDADRHDGQQRGRR
jgi:Ni,Fe-hydrogenase III small subunit